MSTPSQRLQAIDALRGLVILIMMVDHVRETFYLHQQVPDPMRFQEPKNPFSLVGSWLIYVPLFLWF